MEYLFAYMALLLLIGVAIVTWLFWQPIKRLTTVELQVQEFRREMREWESDNQIR